MYVAKFEAAIDVLHCFQKKTRAIRQIDTDMMAKRHRDLIQELGK